MRKDWRRLQFEIDGDEIVSGYAALKNRRPRREHRRRSCDWTKIADGKPIEFWSHRSRNKSGKGKGRAIGDVDAVELETVLAQVIEQRLVGLGRAETLRGGDHL